MTEQKIKQRSSPIESNFFEPNRLSIQDAPISDINMTPLIDVMLVLLVIFILTAPLLTHSIQVQLPKNSPPPANGPAVIDKKENVQITINAKGNIYWENEAVDLNQLQARYQKLFYQNKSATIQIRADEKVAYEWVAKTMALAQKQGLTHIAFILHSAD